jgi:hypothetical protein
MAKRYILMADVIKSTRLSSSHLMLAFKETALRINREISEAFYSPITITLGDEFQSVVRSLRRGADVILRFEESLIKERENFQMRYVLNYGDINTPINKIAAYGMLGPGLLETRSLLEKLKNSRDRFLFQFENDGLAEKLNMIFRLYQMVVDGWRPRDYPVVAEFLREKDYKIVAERLNKDKSLMWKRERSLNISAYLTIKELVYREIGENE